MKDTILFAFGFLAGGFLAALFFHKAEAFLVSLLQKFTSIVSK